MVDDLKQAEHRDPAVAPPLQAETLPPAKTTGAPWLFVVLLLAALAWLAWEKWGPQEQGDIVATSLLTFEKQNALTVFSSRFDVVAQSVNTPSVGPIELDMLETRQAMIVPATVEYRLDLSAMDASDFAWDEATRQMNVTLPPLTLSTPNLDEGNARYFTDGIYVSRDASTALSQSNSQAAQRRAIAFARNAEVMALARTAAREAVQQNLAIPLQVAGFGDVDVRVRFADEG